MGAATESGRFFRLLAEPPRALVLCACAAILLVRRAQAFSNPQLWAEDGHFYERAYAIGARALLLPYAGYLHLVPRSVAAVAARADPAWVPAIFVISAALLTLYVAARTLSPRCPLPRTAGLFALAVVLVPDTYEVLLNIVNLQWVLAAGLVLLLVSRDPSGRAEWVHDCLSALFLGLTGPFSCILSLLFVWRAASRRSAPSAVLAAVVLACGFVQGYLIFTGPLDDPGVPGAPHLAMLRVIPAVGRRIGASLLLGSLLPADLGVALGYAAGIATVGAVGYLALRDGAYRTERRMIAAALVLVLGASLFRTRWTLHEYFVAHSSSRYMFLPQLLSIWLLGTLACQKGRAGRAALSVALWCLAVNAPRLRESAYPDMQWGRYTEQIRAGKGARIPINPPGWILTLPARPK